MASRESSHKVQVRSSTIQKDYRGTNACTRGRLLGGRGMRLEQETTGGERCSEADQEGLTGQPTQGREPAFWTALPAAAIHYDVLSSPI